MNSFFNQKAPTELPLDVQERLKRQPFKHTNIVTVFYVFEFDHCCYAGVIGDGDNGGYEWFIWESGALQFSDVGYGGKLVALRDLLLQLEPLSAEQFTELHQKEGAE